MQIPESAFFQWLLPSFSLKSPKERPPRPLPPDTGVEEDTLSPARDRLMFANREATGARARKQRRAGGELMHSNGS